MGIEPDTKEFFLKILNTVSLVLFWMMLNVFFGVYKEYAFFEDHPNWINYLYYFIFLITLLLIIIYIKRKWKL